MASSTKQFDVCIVALADLRIDARTINIATALSSSGLRVVCVAPDISNGAVFEGFTTMYVPVGRTHGTPKQQRLWQQWMEFSRSVMSIRSSISSRMFWASDLWSLRAARGCARYHRAALLYDAREMYSALGTLSKRPLMQFAVSMMERYYAGAVDRITVSGPMDAEYVRAQLRRQELPDVILNVPPLSWVQSTDTIRQQCSIPHEHSVALYQGAVLEGRGIGVLIDAMEFAPHMHACILGDGPARAMYMEYASAKPWHDRIHFPGGIPNSELAVWTASADVGMCFIEPQSLSYRLALPHKLFEYAMARIPALVSDLPAMRRVMEQFPFGELVAATASPQECAQLLERLVRNASSYVPFAEAAAAVYNREAQHAEIVRIATETMNAHD